MDRSCFQVRTEEAFSIAIETRVLKCYPDNMCTLFLLINLRIILAGLRDRTRDILFLDA